MAKSRRELDKELKATEKAIALIKVLSIVAFIIHGLFLLGVCFVLVLFFISSESGYLHSSERTVVLVVATIIGIFSLSAFNGVISMRKGKKKGFFYFALGSVVLAAITFVATYFAWNQQSQILNVFLGLLLLFLVFALGSQQKYLK